jgi:hypothetical protein
MLLLAVAGSVGGCIRAPEIVLVDRATALEQQAAGSYPDLERKLERAALTPRPVPLTPEQLESLGIGPPAIQDTSEVSDPDRVDALLQQRCIGEGKDGLLADTHDACRGAADRAQANRLVERVNSARLQLWRWMHGRRPDLPKDEVKRTWQKAHARGVPCGGWMQRDDGGWEAKKC